MINKSKLKDRNASILVFFGGGVSSSRPQGGS